MANAPSAIGAVILDKAVQTGGETWSKIKAAMPLYVDGYAQSLVNIAQSVLDHDFTVEEGKLYAQHASLMLEMGVANASMIVLYEVQTFLNSVISAVKTAINNLLPVALL